jgi:hypothetical protein
VKKCLPNICIDVDVFLRSLLNKDSYKLLMLKGVSNLIVGCQQGLVDQKNRTCPKSN